MLVAQHPSRSRSLLCATHPRRSAVVDLAVLDLGHGPASRRQDCCRSLQSPQTAPGLYPDTISHPVMKLKNTLRHLRGAELITHLGLEYYD